MNKSESIKELATALSKAQGEMKNPAFDAANPHFRSMYASFASVRDTVMPVLSKHGLSVAQFPVAEDNRAGCETFIMHESGEFMSSVLLLPVDKLTAQGFGGAQTYARRYALMGVCGVVGDNDDDGNAASKAKPVSTSKPIVSRPIQPTTGSWDDIDADRAKEIVRLTDVVKEHWSCGDIGLAHNAWTAIHFHEEGEKIAAWTCFDSKLRAALKKHNEALRKAQAESTPAADPAPEPAEA